MVFKIEQELGQVDSMFQEEQFVTFDPSDKQTRKPQGKTTGVLSKKDAQTETDGLNFYAPGDEPLKLVKVSAFYSFVSADDHHFRLLKRTHAESFVNWAVCCVNFSGEIEQTYK